VSPGYAKMATTPSAHGPDYGFLWWLNTKQALWPGSPADAYRAVGQGGNIILISPSHDLVVVWRWSAEAGEGFRRVVAAITS
jgi:CubicO group peptidase (beta-lactamase class C family)